MYAIGTEKPDERVRRLSPFINFIHVQTTTDATAFVIRKRETGSKTRVSINRQVAFATKRKDTPPGGSLI